MSNRKFLSPIHSPAGTHTAPRPEMNGPTGLASRNPPRSEVDSLTNRLQRLNEENDDLLDRLSEAKRLRERREGEFDAERAALTRRIRDLEAGHEDFLEEIRGFKARIDAYEGEVVELREELGVAEEGAEGRGRGVRGQLEARLRGEGRVRELESELIAARKENEEMAAAMHAKNERLKKELEENLMIISELRSLSERQSEGTENEKQEELRRELGRVTEQLQRALSDSATKKIDFSRKSKVMQGEIVRLSRLVEDLDKQLEGKTRKTGKDGEVQSPRTAIKKLDAEVERLQKELDKRNEELEERSQQDSKAAARVRELEGRLAGVTQEYSKEIDRLQEELETKEKELANQIHKESTRAKGDSEQLMRDISHKVNLCANKNRFSFNIFIYICVQCYHVKYKRSVKLQCKRASVYIIVYSIRLLYSWTNFCRKAEHHKHFPSLPIIGYQFV